MRARPSIAARLPYAKPSRFYISRLYRLQQVDASKGTMIYLPRPADSALYPWVQARVSAALADMRHYFQQFYLLPRTVFRVGIRQRKRQGGGEVEEEETLDAINARTSLTVLFSPALFLYPRFFSLFSFAYPTRDPPRNCDTADSASGFHLMIPGITALRPVVLARFVGESECRRRVGN